MVGVNNSIYIVLEYDTKIKSHTPLRAFTNAIDVASYIGEDNQETADTRITHMVFNFSVAQYAHVYTVSYERFLELLTDEAKQTRTTTTKRNKRRKGARIKRIAKKPKSNKPKKFTFKRSK